MVVTATFATWFWKRVRVGDSGQFIKNGLEGVVEEPVGSSMALILVGVFFARKLYKMSLLTVGDFYRRRYGVSVELVCSIFVVLSYLGWVAAQVAALGLVMHILTEGYISVSVAMIIGTIVVLIYTVFGGMWSVALTDFFQMIIIVIGLALVAVFRFQHGRRGPECHELCCGSRFVQVLSGKFRKGLALPGFRLLSQ